MRVGQRGALGAVLVLLMIGGCTYGGLYFKRTDKSEVQIDRYVIRPRVVFYDGSGAGPQVSNDGGFRVSIRVEDPESGQSSESWRQEPALVDSLAEAFLGEVFTAFVPDSLVLHQMPEENERILLRHDSRSYSPRRDDYFTLQFGAVDIPASTSQLRLVLHVSRPGDNGVTVPDSAYWQMFRAFDQKRGLKVIRRHAQGYE